MMYVRTYVLWCRYTDTTKTLTCWRRCRKSQGIIEVTRFIFFSNMNAGTIYHNRSNSCRVFQSRLKNGEPDQQTLRRARTSVSPDIHQVECYSGSIRVYSHKEQGQKLHRRLSECLFSHLTCPTGTFNSLYGSVAFPSRRAWKNYSGYTCTRMIHETRYCQELLRVVYII